MIPFPRYLKLSALLASGLILCAHGAETPQHIDVKQLSKKVEDVVVPLPNEVFGALNKLGSINWKEYVRSDKGSNFTERPRIALLLGTVIADGFIAVQAEDAPAVKEIGQRLQAMPEFDLAIIRDIRGALVEVKPLIDVGRAHISSESVKKINDITTRLDNGIVTRE